MKKLRRFLCFALLLMLTALSLTACHGTRGTAEFVLPEEFDESKEYEITFWAKNDTNKAQSLLYQQTIDEFESYYPNIRVNLRQYRYAHHAQRLHHLSRPCGDVSGGQQRGCAAGRAADE